MKKKIATLMVLMAITGLASADTQIQASLNSRGNTQYRQELISGGSNWQKTDGGTGSWYLDTPNTIRDFKITEVFQNTGGIKLDKQVHTLTRSDGSTWDVMESKQVTGFGETTIHKEAKWRTSCNAVGEGGLLEFPTLMLIDVDFSTANMADSEHVDNTANTDNNWNTFEKTIMTTDDFKFEEFVVKNPTEFVPTPPAVF